MKNLKAALANGEVLFGTIVVSGNPVNVEISGYLGYDCVFIDSEHASNGPYGPDMEHLIRAADAADIAALVRVAQNDPDQIKKCLDFGAKGIIAPFINTREDALRLVEASLYPPKGNRGAAPCVRATKYGAVGWFDYVDWANNELIIMPILERMKAIENLEEILSVEGINSVCMGCFDLAMELGLRPEGRDANAQVSAILRDPVITKHLEYVLETCRKRNIPVANIGWSVESILEMVERGCQIVFFTGDNNMFIEIGKHYLEKVRQELKPQARPSAM